MQASTKNRGDGVVEVGLPLKVASERSNSVVDMRYGVIVNELIVRVEI